MADVEPPLVSTRNLVGSVIHPKSDKILSDHLSSTKTFLQLQRNGIVNVKPDAVHFDGFIVGRISHKILRITNESVDPQRIHILPPSTSEIKIHYLKKGSLYPGLHLDVKISFLPKSWKYHYDSVRIHCSHDTTLLVPIHAYPKANVSKFPQKLSFPPTPLGQSISKSFSLSSDAPVEFNFKLREVEKNDAFTVSPMEGIIPGKGKTVVCVTYTPVDYTTAVTRLKLDVSQFNWKSLTCTCVGTSSPGLALEGCNEDEKTKATIPLAPLERLRLQRMKKKSKPIAKGLQSSTSLPKVQKETVYQGYRIPIDMSNPTAVCKILNQEPGKLKASELRAPDGSSGGSLGDLVRRQVKESSFIQMVKASQDQERSNQYKWVTKMGATPLSDEERSEILKSREPEEKKYRSEAHREFDCFISGQITLYKRTIRKAQETLTDTPEFSNLGVDNWARRHAVLVRFASAARKVLIRNRCLKRLEKLKQISTNLHEPAREIPAEVAPQIKLENVTTLSYPYENENGNSKWGAFKNTNAVEVNLPSHVAHRSLGLMELQVPQEFRLLGYQPHPLPSLDSYVLPGLPRHLRTGATEETQAVSSHNISCSTMYSTTRTVPVEVKEHSVCLEDLEEAEEDTFNRAASLAPPSSLFKWPSYPPVDIFAPCSNMNPSLPVLPHSEVELSSKLQPLSMYPVSVGRPSVILDSLAWKEDKSPFIVFAEKYRGLEGKPQHGLLSRTTFMDDFFPLDSYQLLGVDNPNVS